MVHVGPGARLSKGLHFACAHVLHCTCIHKLYVTWELVTAQQYMYKRQLVSAVVAMRIVR